MARFGYKGRRFYRRGNYYKRGGRTQRGVYKGKRRSGRYRSLAGRPSTRGFYKNGITAELKYWDYDPCASYGSVGPPLVQGGAGYPVSTGPGWISQLGPGGQGGQMVLCNYPTQIPGTASPGSYAGATNSIFLINQIQQGDDIFNRIGRKINIKSLTLKINVFPSANQWMVNPVAAPNELLSTTVRVMIVFDSQINNVTSISLKDVLRVQDTNTYATMGQSSGAYIDASPNLDNRDRFTIISDKWFNVGNVSAGPGAGVLKIYKKFKKSGLPIIYSGNTGISISTGGIWVIVGGNNGDVPGTTPSNNDGASVGVNFLYTMTTRLRYTDA